MVNPLKIISDYKHLNLPLDMVARNNNVSLAYAIDVIHYQCVEKPKAIKKCKEIIKELEDERFR